MKKLLLISLSFCFFINISIISAKKTSIIIDSPESISIEFLSTVKNDQKKQDIFSHVLYSYIDKNEFTKLNNLINSNIIKSQGIFKSLSIDLALYFYSKHSAKKTIEFLQTLSPNLISFLTETCFYEALKKKNINDAILFSESLNENIIYSRLILSIIEFFLVSDDISSALKWLIQIELPSENDLALSLFCNYYAKNNNYTELKTYLSLIQSTDVKLSVYSNLAVIFAQEGIEKLSDTYLTYLENTSLKDTCLLRLIESYANINRVEKAILLAKQIQSDNLKYKALIALAKGFARNSNFIGVNESYKQLYTDEIRTKFIFSVSPVLAQEKFIDEAYALTTKLNLQNNLDLMNEIAFNYGKFCDYNFSKLTLQKISDPKIKDSALSQFSIGLAYKDNFSFVLNSLDLISSTNQKDNAILNIIQTNLFPNKTNDLIERLSPDEKLNYIYKLTAPSITPNTIDPAFDIILSFSKRNLTKEFSILYYIKLAELYAYENVPKKPKKYIKKAYKQLKRLKYNVNLATINTFVKNASQMGEFGIALNAISKYPNKEDQLYLLASLSLTTDLKKLKPQIKSLELFAKRYKK